MSCCEEIWGAKLRAETGLGKDIHYRKERSARIRIAAKTHGRARAFAEDRPGGDPHRRVTRCYCEEIFR